MKYSTTIYFIASLIWISFSVSAQEIKTGEESMESKKVDVKGVNMPKADVYGTWDVGVNFGACIPNTDLAANDLNKSNNKYERGLGINVNKYFTHSFALQGQFFTGKLKGDANIGSNGQYNYKTDINYEFTIHALFQAGNISFLKRNPNFAFYGYMGIGYINFSPMVYKDGSDDGHNYYVQGDQKPVDNSVDYTNTTELVFPIGVGFKYRLGKKFTASIEYSIRLTNSDKLDGWYRLLSDKDNYDYFNLGLTYHIGKDKEPIEWVNPMYAIYTDVYDVKEKVKLLGNDSDDDGVADIFDREPQTPKGAKVYGDGTSVDSDGDGVSDFTDIEPFSPKGVKVDAAGKEIDTDGDGIGDSNDLEPNTPKGSLINVQGIAIPKPVKGGASSVMAASGWLPSIFFDLNSAVIAPKYNETLASIALILRNNPDVSLELVGNCDSRASKDYNAKLGKRRSESVRNHLIKKYNIDPKRLTIRSLGKEDPITKDHPMNRRVDFKVLE